MSKKTFTLVSAILGAIQAAAVGIVTFTNPDYSTAINSSIVIAGTAILEICNKFLKPEESK